MRRKRENETPQEQESRRESNRLRMAHLRASETVEEQGTRRKFNSLQMMQTRISETAQNREVRLERQRNVTHCSRMAIWKDKENAAYFYNPSIDYKSDTSCILGPMSISCQFCDAMKFKGEAPGLCCSGGKVHLPVLRDPPEPLHTLLSSDSIYFIDSNTEQAEQRCKIVQQVKQDLVLKLQDMLQRNNSYIKSFKSAIEKLGPDFRIIIHADKVPAEWQKRGLPHPHILVWLQETLHVHKVDDFISAEIPNPEEDPELFNCITTQMVHGPCGVINPFSPCMKNGRCTKRYPRDFLKETQTGRDGYPLYRRRRPEDGGFSTVINIRHSEVVVDNRWIVPYCPLLSRIFCAHINVEYCNSTKSIQYVCKYINKGSDMAVFDVTSSDGNGSFTSLDPDGAVSLKNIGRIVNTEEELLRAVFPNLPDFFQDHVWLCPCPSKSNCTSGYVPESSMQLTTTFLLQIKK
ncbi:ATP-dependent DNA helicase PIF1 [Trichonephila clavata]|uniref:ATP-dependent DNA helicase PIF1 n=1 Tax=Trichonephila clavata TaxID=2740835 RepID=A0A8X6FL23_TRICU|nr:ATP-dependent DNA helicase PIF1 [Trichonephila clavata]